MSVASYFNTEFVRTELVGITDVQTIIDQIDTILTSTLPADSRWTSLGSGEYRCPANDPNGANRYFSVTLVRDSATQLSFQVKDRGGNNVQDGCVQISSGSSAKIWAGDYHLCVELNNAGSLEVAYGIMLDPTPFDGSMSGIYVAAFARRNSAGSLQANNFIDQNFVLDGSSTPSTSSAQRLNTFRIHAGSPNVETSGGSDLAMPVTCELNLGSNTWYFGGYYYQCLLVKGGLSAGAEVEVGLDSGVNGTFEVCGIGASNIGSGLMAFRKA